MNAEEKVKQQWPSAYFSRLIGGIHSGDNLHQVLSSRGWANSAEAWEEAEDQLPPHPTPEPTDAECEAFVRAAWTGHVGSEWEHIMKTEMDIARYALRNGARIGGGK